MSGLEDLDACCSNGHWQDAPALARSGDLGAGRFKRKERGATARDAHGD
jgi:hypothetical protein